MRVLFTSHASVVEVYQDKLAHIARYPGIELQVLLPERYLEGTSVVDAYTGHAEFSTSTLPTRLGAKGRQNGFTYIGLKRWLAQRDFDIVHMEEEPESLVTLQLLRAFEHSRKRPRFIGLTSRNYDLTKERYRLWNPNRYLAHRIQAYTLNRLDALIGVPQESVSIFRTLGYRGLMPVIPQFGISSSRFWPMPNQNQLRAEKGLSGFVFGYVGRILEMKGLHYALRAFASLNLPDARFVILGDGPYKQTLLELASELGITSNVHFYNAVPFRDIPLWMNCFDVFLLPSIDLPTWREQFGRVLIEAMACGVPVIGSDSGEIPHVIRHGGVVTKQANTKSIADALNLLYHNADMRRTLSADALLHVSENYSNESVAARIVALYRSVGEREAPQSVFDRNEIYR